MRIRIGRLHADVADFMIKSVENHFASRKIFSVSHCGVHNTWLGWVATGASVTAYLFHKAETPTKIQDPGATSVGPLF